MLSHGTNLSAGVAVPPPSGMGVNISRQKEVCKGRLSMVRAKINNLVFVFINVYAPSTVLQSKVVVRTFSTGRGVYVGLEINTGIVRNHIWAQQRCCMMF